MLGLVNLMNIPTTYTMSPYTRTNRVTITIGPERSISDQEAKGGLDEVMLDDAQLRKAWNRRTMRVWCGVITRPN